MWIPESHDEDHAARHGDGGADEVTIVEAQISDLDHNDVDAIHDNVAGEIAAITEKAVPVSADLLLIEDSAAANAKMRVQVGNLPSGASALDDLTDVAITTPTLGEVLKYDGSGWVNDTDDTGSGSLPTASTKGDIAVYNGSAWVVVSAGANDTVLTADSAQTAGVKWASGGGGGYELIEEIDLASAAAAIEFSSIAATWSDLLISAQLRSDDTGGSADLILMRFGGSALDTGTNYAFRSDDSVSSVSDDNGTAFRLRVCNAEGSGGSTAGNFSSHDIRIRQPANTGLWRGFTHIGFAWDDDGSSAAFFRTCQSGGLWRNTADAIEIIRLFPLTGSNWVAGSIARLYGIATS